LFKTFQSFNRCAPFKPLRRATAATSTCFGTRDPAPLFALAFRGKKSFGLSVLNYMITSNHVHLLIKDTGPNVIADNMQLIAGRTAQEYNQRKDRQRAFWEDRYHATAIEADEHLHRCLIYIDLNMVRAIEY
jgi:Transposase IS200 like